MTRLEEIRGRWANITPGAWKYDSCSGRVYASPKFDLHRFDQMDTDIFKVEELEADGIAAAHAPTDIAVLTAAIKAALALHRIVLVDALDGNGNGIYECNECHYEPDGHEECPTVAAIYSALDSQP